LRVLAHRSTPVSGSQLARLANAGTEAGVRRAVERLADHGVCRREEIGGRLVYSLNFDHVLYPSIAELLKVNRALRRRLKARISEWDPAPTSAVLFGSAARGDGGIGSDVDVVLIRPTLNESRKREWVRQVHDLRESVSAWTGNRLQVLDWTRTMLERHARADERVVDAIVGEGITLHGMSVAEMLKAVR
jgi:predicted nucleotidyltransferase